MAKKNAAGSKADKLPKEETEEERMLRLEMEALAAEQKAQMQAELSRVTLRQKQQREQECARINSMKIHNQWRKIMRVAKVEELRGEVEILSQSHEREVDRKDALVQLLDRDLEVAEEQHQTALGAHLMVLDSLLDLQAARLAGLERQYNKDLKDLLDEAATERTDITSSHAKAKKELQDMAEAMKAEFNDADTDARQEFESVREEVRNRNSEEYNVLKIQLEGIIEELERHFEQAHKVYLEGTEHRTAAFNKLTQGDAGAARVIEQRMKKLIKLQEDLQHWRTKIATNNREWEARNAALRREKELMAWHYVQLKTTLDRGRAAAAERLKQLSVTSGTAMQDLRSKLSRAEAILKLAGMCRKLETEQEKVLPFHNLSEAVPVPEQPHLAQWDQQQQQQQDQSRDQDQHEQQDQQQQLLAGQLQDLQVSFGQQQWEQGGKCSQPASPSLGLQQQQQQWCAVGLDDSGQPVSDWDYLNRFFKRYNKVVLDVAAVSKERGRLEQENADLRQLLKTFLDGISVNDAVLNSPTTPLLVVNSRLQHTLAQQRKARTTTQAPGSPKLMLSGVAAAGTAGPGSRLGSPKGGSASTRTVGPLTGRSALSASAAAGGAAVMTGTSPAAAAAVAGGLVMSPRSSTAPAAATRTGQLQKHAIAQS